MFHPHLAERLPNPKRQFNRKQRDKRALKRRRDDQLPLVYREGFFAQQGKALVCWVLAMGALGLAWASLWEGIATTLFVGKWIWPVGPLIAVSLVVGVLPMYWWGRWRRFKKMVDGLEREEHGKVDVFL